MRARMHFDGMPASVPGARRFVTDHLGDCGAGLTDVVALLASELATNAVVHAGSSFDVELTWTDRTVRVAVSDDGQELPRQLSVTTADEHGRGIHLLTALSTDWGIEDLGTGKTVWFEVMTGTVPPG